MSEEPEKPNLADIIAKRFAGVDQPATVEMVADLYAKMALISDALVALIRYSAGDPSAENKRKNLDEALSAITRLSREIASSITKLSAPHTKVRDGE